MNKGFMGLMLGVVVAGLGLGALLAAKTAPAATPVVQVSGQFNAAGPQGGATSGSNSGRAAAGMTAGTVSAKDGDTATVKTQQGDLKVKLTGVQVEKTVDGTSDDLKAGTPVVVMGQQGADGTVTASSVQIRAANAGNGAGGQGRANQASGQGQAQGQRQGQGQGVRPIMGTVSTLDGNTLTISGPQGDTKVNIAGAKIEKTAAGTADDVAVGTSVAMVGQAGSDGSFAATTIQIRPAAAPANQPAATPAQGS